MESWLEDEFDMHSNANVSGFGYLDGFSICSLALFECSELAWEDEIAIPHMTWLV